MATSAALHDSLDSSTQAPSTELAQWNTARIVMVALALYFNFMAAPLLAMLIALVGGVLNRGRRSVLIVLVAVGLIACYQFAITGRLLVGLL